MMKSMLLTTSRHSNIHHTTLAYRTLFLLSFLLLNLGGVWGQSVQKTITRYQAANSENPVEANFYDDVKKAFEDLGRDFNSLTDLNCFTRWDVVNDKGEYFNINNGWENPTNAIHIKHDGLEWLFKYSNNNSIQYGYSQDEYNKLTVTDNLKADVLFGSDFTQLGCKIECYVTNNRWNQNSDPTDGYIVKVELILNEGGSEPFLGELIGDNKKSGTQEVNRSETPATIDLQMAYDEWENSDNLQYARFYLTDNKGNLVSPEGKLVVKYGDEDAKECPVTNQGYYIYTGSNLTPNDISVTFAAPNNEYKLYKVVGVFSKNMTNAKADGVNLSREPDWDLQYTYSFTYNPTTNNYDEQQVEWKRYGIKPVASVGNIDAEWDISQDELSLGYYVKWYIKNGDQTQPLAMGSGRQDEKWTIEVSGFTVNTENEAVLTGTGTFNWDMWGKPTIYAPADKEFVDVKDCKIYCEVYANSDITGKNPNAHYTFSLYKSFLGELRDDDSRRKDGETKVDLDKNESTVILSLENALNSYEAASLTRAAGPLQYARIWLETTDGTKEAPGEKLVISNSAVKLYGDENNDYAIYGYYLSGDNINETLRGLTAELNLPEAFNQYQVHVALSTDAPIMDNGKVASEPDYDYEYTYSFTYASSIETESVELDLSDTDLKGREITITFNQGHFPNFKHQNIWDYFGKSNEELGGCWYAHWYVVKDINNLDEKELIQSSKDPHNEYWTITHFQNNDNWPTDKWKDIDKKIVWSDNVINGLNPYDPSQGSYPGWYFEQVFANQTRISVPQEYTVEKYVGYKIVLEITDENPSPSNGENPPSPLPDIQYRFVFEIPKDDFLGKAQKPEQEEGSKEIEKNIESASFTLEQALKAPKEVKYARIILCDATGNALNGQELLTVVYDGEKANKAGKFAKNGVYIYNGGTELDLSKINITLNAGAGNMNKYRIKCLLATDDPADKGDVDNNGNVTHEPDWVYEFIYRFTYPSRNNFEAENINDVKTKYKTAVYDTTSRKATIRLFSNWIEVTGDCNVSKEGFRNAYARWYLTDTDGNVIPGIKSLTKGYSELNGNNGYYRQDFNPANFREGQATTENGNLYNNNPHEWDYQDYNPTIELTTDANVKYTNVRIVCVVTTLLDEINMPNQEPEMMQVKYVYTLKTKKELEEAPFVHYKGESHRDYLTPAGATGATYSWNHETGIVEDAPSNIRQNVHQTDYYIYIDPSKFDSKTPDEDNLLLTLPIEDWIYTPVEPVKPEDNPAVRSSTEPLGYFRWYDWNKDKISPYLDPYKVVENRKYDDASNGNGYKSKLETKDYGLVALMLDANSYDSYRDEIGVVFNNDGLTALGKLAEGEEIVIACDVSRYMDGIVLDGDSYFWTVNVPLRGDKTDRRGQIHKNKYLVHEPTLSMRYIFHIMPAKKIAKDIEDAAGMLNKVVASANDADKWENLEEQSRSKAFQTYEDNGWVVVPMNGKFSLRVDLQDLNQYFISNNNTFVQCNNLQWYSYYEDEKGLWKMKINMNGRNTLRLAKYDAIEFSGEYTKVGASDTHTITVGNATQLHLVGYLGNGTIEQPVVHYGLEFTKETPIDLEAIKKAQKDYIDKESNSQSYRTDAYMYEHLTHGGTLNFDEFFTEATRYDRPTTSYENYAETPMVFENAQYGYSYPQLYGQCASGWQIYHGGWWNGYGIAPTHSDYTLLKTMNVPEVSASETYIDQSIYTYWYDPNLQPLYDLTHEYDNSKYGTYLYIDAADEARTIAQLKFEASLCANSEIFYTAYVANMTPTTSTPPQVMFRVSTDIDDGNGGKKRIPVVSFLTGDIQSQGANQTATWYQVYGSTKIPKELEHIVNGDPRTYYVAIDNYCEDTKGADYTIDQISFFTTTAKVQILQSSTPCDESSGIEVAILAKASDLTDYANNGDVLYYRIFKRNSENVLKVADAVVGKGIYQGEDGYHYGSVKFFDNPTTDINDAESSLGPGETGYYYSNGEWYFQFDRREFDLDVDATYFVSFYSLLNKVPPTDEDNSFCSGWGNPYSGDVCRTMYSNDITPRMLRIDFKEDDTDYDGAINIPCDESEAKKNFTITVQYPTPDGGYSPTTVLFDYYIGPKREFKGIKEGDLFLETALEHMREYYQKPYTSSDELPTEYKEDDNSIAYTAAMHDLIAEYMNKGKLILSATKEFNYTFTDTGEYRFAAIPVDRWTADGYICSPLEFVFDVKKAAGGPQLNLGFKDVTYPNNTRVVRVGLEQLDNVKNSGTHTLHIPVHSFEYKNKEKTDNSIVFYGENLVLWSTDDPANKEREKPVVATLLDDVNTGRPMVNSDHQYLAVKFKDDFTFHEGYQYELHTVYYDLEDDNGNKPREEACATNDLTFIIKVVPKYVTWKGGNKQWNNDTNWNRSKGDELYKEDYKDTQDMEPTPSTYPAYVPMKFTYVTMPSDNIAPSLMNLEIDDSEGIYTQNSMGRDTTDYIRYDLMVRYTEENCVTEGHEGHNTEKKIYDCEKFYGNWAKEIYFKPNAELVNQHYLTYEKVWVEKELEANTWTLMSTPLQNTYAGDMYVPSADGRQETEAFKDITFGAGYSRTLYPIYQRSWAQTGSTVYTSTDDMYRSNYSANLSGTVSSTFTLWSHTYNDVTVDYSTWKGFAIRAHKKGQDKEALLRLPKEDTSYDYYLWDGVTTPELATTNDVKTVEKTDNEGKTITGRLFTDGEEAPDNRKLTYGVEYDYNTTTDGKKKRTAGTGTIEVPISELQNAKDAAGNYYLLVGNPYLCSINMEKFLSANADKLDESSGYWTYENNKIDSKEFSTDNYIKPLQSFFVKLKSDATTGNIVFNEDMMIDRSNSPIQSAPALTLTASNGRGQSSATVSVGEEARSVETLFDSNLEDVPMVYTVADGQAVSINQLTELSQPVAFGVTCVASNDPVEVTFTDIDQLTGGDIYVVDAVTGSLTTIGEGDSYTVQPNDYGRYFLLAGTTAIDDKTDVAKGIMVSVRGREVTVTSGEELTQVHALTLNGTTHYETTTIGTTTTSFTLSSGVYIIKAENMAGEQQTMKVVIR